MFLPVSKATVIREFSNMFYKCGGDIKTNISAHPPDELIHPNATTQVGDWEGHEGGTPPREWFIAWAKVFGVTAGLGAKGLGVIDYIQLVVKEAFPMSPIDCLWTIGWKAYCIKGDTFYLPKTGIYLLTEGDSGLEGKDAT